VAAICIALLGLAGWAFDIAVLRSILQGHVAMTPLTAMCFILAGSSLWFQRHETQHKLVIGAARACAVAVMLLAALRLLEYATGLGVGLDQVEFPSRSAANRMAPSTAFNFILIGLSLGLLDFQMRRGYWPAQFLALASATGSTFSLLGYAYGASPCYGIASSNAMALDAAVTFHILALGILAARPARGIMAVITSDSSGGMAARRLLPIAIFVPLGLSWLGLQGEHAGLYDTSFGVALAAAGSIIALLGMIWWTARLQNRTDLDRALAQQALEEAHAALRLRASEVETANQELESFSYSVSHDLRAPLRAIEGYSGILLDDYGDRLDEAAQRYLERIRAATTRMGQLIDDLLNLSRLSRGEMSRERVDLSALAASIGAELQRSEPDRQVEFIVAGNMFMDGDQRLIRVVLENLLGNAWKFTGKRERASIEFGGCAHQGSSVFFIRDNGVGFDMAYANKLFSPFHRLHAMTDFPGTGIGLATVQRIVHRHGGHIWAEGSVGGGATFYFTLSQSEEATNGKAHPAGGRQPR
jgi:signal transduction histidine kinase